MPNSKVTDAETSRKFEMPKPAMVIETTVRPNVDIKLLSAQKNFGAGGRARKINEIFDDSLQSDVIWQPDVYNEAAELARSTGIRRVIDVGCGSGLKLHAVFSGTEVELVGVDFARSLNAARRCLIGARLIECDLCDWRALSRLEQDLGDSEPVIVIAADVIEHLPDPLPMLACIRNIIARNPASRLVLSTPDRHRLNYADPDGMPRNLSHVREWTLAELNTLVTSLGFGVVRAGHTRANQREQNPSTSFLVCRFDQAQLEHGLKVLGIQSSMAVRHLLLTTEYAGLGPSGGIGTFVAGQHRRDRDSTVLLISDNELAKRMNGVIRPQDILSVEECQRRLPSDLALAVVQRLLLLLPALETVEFQDYCGIGFRICQAKRAGILPVGIRTVVHCHGNVHYLENASQHWLEIADPAQTQREKLSVELADVVVFPSQFLRALYGRMGFQIQGIDGIRPYVHGGDRSAPSTYGPIENIIFVGKRSRMKGFDLFMELFNERFCQTLHRRGVTKITLVGPSDNFASGTDVDRIKSLFEFRELRDLNHKQLTEFIKSNAANSLVLEPYRADNFPLAVYDVVMNGGFLLAADAGGIPEIFPSNRWKECLLPLKVESAREKVLSALALSSEDRGDIVSQLAGSHDDNEAQYGTYRNWPSPKESVQEVNKVAVVVPFFNTAIPYLEDLFYALNEQSRAPDEVLIVDDASDPDVSKDMEEVAVRMLKVPYRILRHNQNKGLAGARNTALFACDADILLNIDSDDVPLCDWVKNIARALEQNPNAAAAVPYLTAFDDGSDFNIAEPESYTYRPIGDGYVACQTENRLGHANGGVRVDYARSAGGWDETTKAKFEDWAFYLNVISRGRRIAIIPRIDVLYRVRKDSMLRTYGMWDGMTRLAVAQDVLPRFESIELQRLARAQTDLAALRSRLSIRIIDRFAARAKGNPLARVVWRATGPVRSWLRR